MPRDGVVSGHQQVGSLDPRIDQEEGDSGRVDAKSPPIGVDRLAADWMAEVLKAHQGAQDGKTCEQGGEYDHGAPRDAVSGTSSRVKAQLLRLGEACCGRTAPA
jgi:hypothetical protein